MNYQFEILTTVYFKHEYYSDGKSKGLNIVPDEDSKAKITNLGLVFHSFEGGFQILFDTSFAGGKRTRAVLVRAPFTLTFHLQLSVPSFYNYTANISKDIIQTLFYFSNISRETGKTNPSGMLHRGAFVTKADLFPTIQFNIHVASKPFGLLDLKINEQLRAEYLINFQAKSTFWRYILVSPYYRDLNHPAILNAENDRIFNGPTRLKLPDGRPAIAFISKNKIRLRDSYFPFFRLVENFDPEGGKFRVVKQALPLPDINTISRVEAKASNGNKTDYSEIFIY